MSVSVGDLVAKLALDASPFDAGMERSEARAKAGAGSIGLAMSGMGLAATGALVASLKAASDYQTMLVHIQANTGMSDAATRAMSTGIQQMASATGAPLDQLATGFMKIANFGFSGAESMKILKPAMESALSTGDDIASVGSILGGVLHEFNLGAKDATTTMNALHLAAQMGSSTLGAFAEGTTRAYNVAASYGVSLRDVTAGLSTLTQANQTARQASDGMAAVFQAIVKPTAGATDALSALGTVTGKNLVAEFSAAGLRSRGFANILADTKAAVETLAHSPALQGQMLAAYRQELIAHHVHGAAFALDMEKMAMAVKNPTQELLKLFPNVRASREAMLLTGTQAASFATHLKAIGDAIAGRVDPTLAGFQRQQASLGAQMAKLHESLQVLAISIGTALLPPVTRLAAMITPIVQGVASWAMAHSGLTAALLGGVAVVGTLVGGFGALGLALSSVGVVVGPLAALVGTLGAPILAVGAAVALLALAWTRDWGGIREIAARALAGIQPALAAISMAVGWVTAAFRTNGLGAALSLGLDLAQALLSRFAGWLGSTALPAIQRAVAGWGSALVGWVAPRIPALLVEARGLLAQLSGWIMSTGLPTVRTQVSTWGGALVGWIAPRIPPLLAEAGALAGRLVAWAAGTALPAVQGQVRSWGTALVGWISPRIGPLLAEAGGLLARLASWTMGTALPALRTALAGWASAFVGWIGPLVPRLLTAAGALAVRLAGWIAASAPVLARAVIAWGTAFVAWVGPQIPPMLAAAGGLLARLGAWIGAQLPVLVARLRAWATGFVSWVVPATTNLVNHLGPMMDRLGGWIGAQLPVLGTRLVAWGTAFWQWLVKAGPDLITHLGSFLGKMLVWVSAAVVGIDAKLLQWGAAFVGWVAPRVGPLLIELAKLILRLDRWILTTALPELAKFGLQMGLSLLAGLRDGIGSGFDSLKDALGGVLTGAHDHAKTVTKSHSPSAVYHELGRGLMEGLAAGIKEGGPLAQTALQQAMEKLSGPALGAHRREGVHAAALSVAHRPAALHTGEAAVIQNITVTIAGSAVTTHGSAQTTEVEALLTKALGDFARTLVQSQRLVSPGASRTLPGAR